MITEAEAKKRNLVNVTSPLRSKRTIAWGEAEARRLRHIGCEAELVLLDRTSNLSESGDVCSVWRDSDYIKRYRKENC